MILSSFSVPEPVLASVSAEIYPPCSSLSSSQVFVVIIWMCPPCAAETPLPVTTLLLESALLPKVIASAVSSFTAPLPFLSPLVLP